MTTTKNKKSSKKYYDLDTTWVDKLYPKISTKEKFLKYIKSVGEEYNEATGTGWKETNTSGVFDFYGNERSSLGGSRVRYWLLGEQLDYFEKGSNSVEDHSSFQTMNITLRDESGIFSFCKNDKIYFLNSKYDFYDLKSKTLLENEVILRVTNEVLDKVKEEFTEIRKSLKKEKKTAATSTAKTEVAKPEKAYSVSQTEEWMKEVFPKVETLENFNKYIKANNLEFNKETGTGWKLIYSNEIHTMMRYYKNHIEDDSNFGIKQVSFIPEKEASKAKLRYAEKGSPESVVTGEYYGYSFIDPSDSTEYFVVHCNQEYFLIDRNGKRHTETFNKEENLLDSARVKFLHSKEEPEVQKPDKIQKYEDINGRWIKELYPQIETLEKFKRYIEEKGIVYNEKTKTGWKKSYTGSDILVMEYFKKGFIEADPIHGISHVSFRASSNESESKLRSANSNRDRLYTKEGFQELESPSGDYFYVSNGKEKLIYDKNGNIQAGPFSTEEEVLKMFKKYVAERPNVLKLKLQEYIPKNYTGIVEWENGAKSWYKKEKFHRLDGPAVEFSDGTKEWRIEGKLHRLDGPAMEYPNGSTEWYKKGNLHREDGPAIEYKNGNKYWYLEGKNYSEENFKKEIERRNQKENYEVQKTIELNDGWVEKFRSQIDTKEKFLAWIKENPPTDGEWKLTSYGSYRLVSSSGKDINDSKLGICFVGFSDEGNIDYVQKQQYYFTEEEVTKGKITLSVTFPDPKKNKQNIKHVYAIQTAKPLKNDYANLKNFVVNRRTDEVKEIPYGGFYGEILKEEEYLLEMKKAQENKKPEIVEKPKETPPPVSFDQTWIKTVLPMINTREKFQTWLKANPPQDSATWSTRYFDDGATITYLLVDKKGYCINDNRLGISVISFNHETFLFAERTSLNEEEKQTKEDPITSINNPFFFSRKEEHRNNGNVFELRIYKKDLKTYKYYFYNTQSGRLVCDEDSSIDIEIKLDKELPIKLSLNAKVPPMFTGIIEWENGSKHWCKDGLLHREDGPAIEWVDGTKKWYKEGKLHRLDGPAIENSDGTKYWYKEGNLHRTDGPAIEYPDGTKEWWIEGKQFLSEESYRKKFLKESKLVYIAKSDAREAAKRVAVNQISKFVQTLILNSVKASSTASSGLNKILDSENGRTALKFIISGAVPILKQHVLPKYGKILDEVAEEFRIQGETELVTGVVDKLIETMQTHSVFNKQLEERIRVQVETEMVKKLSPPSVELSFAEIENQSDNVYEIASKIK